MERLITWIKDNVKLVVKYGLAGITGAIIQVVFLYLFVDQFGFFYLYGVVCAYLIALITVFTIQKFWTFEDRRMDTLERQSLWYAAIAVGTLLFNIFGMYLLVEVMNLWHIGSQVVVVGIAGFLSFLVNKSITFKQIPDEIN